MAINPCPTFIPCKPCADGNPFQNRSAEAPDPADFFSFQFVQDIPPLGGLDNWWAGTAIPGGCFASTQELADDCARRVGEEQIVDEWRDKNGITLPLFGNTPQSCSVVCPLGGDPFVYTVPAGTVIARTQEEADALAASYCQFRALEHRACGPLAITLDATNIITNATLNGSVDPDNAATTWYFQWGATTAYGNITPAQIIPGSNDTTLVSAIISGFGATTHFRLVAMNANGTSFGADKTFQAVILPPQAWWKMEDNAVDMRFDVIAGRVMNRAGGLNPFQQTTGKVANGVELIVPIGAGEAAIANFTYNGSVIDFTFWFKVTMTGIKLFDLPSLVFSNGRGILTEARLGSGGSDFYNVYDGSFVGPIIINIPASFTLGDWHFQRILVDGANLQVGYQIDNGPLLIGVIAGPNPPASASNTFQVDSNTSGLGPGTGDVIIDEVAFWDRKLTQPELDILYNNGIGVTWPIT
jgi:hypothetical protein